MTQTASINTDQLQQQIQHLQHVLQQGGNLGQLVNISTDESDALYQLGHGLYEQGRYNEAFKAFSLLAMTDHLNERNVQALANTAQMLERYEDALQHYTTLAVLRLDDPSPLFHSSECLVALARIDDAIDTLELAIEMDPEDQHGYTAKSRAILALLRQRHAEASQHDSIQ
ncbi:SycD/LcrH family type III secretion system chaperone [Alcaligenes endophyticus]|uniref:SycD/LcrH family type III secretion system chaperone n=1 Tax=Alcaligenes endophyticus TaxID=1929088 RepID=A0ABT8EFL3_9BURK|nr:SycD/LcrH family type III secretion system chaperone [Alcaligenes endophyticus]MCX5590268.1 SycD/LcrH family type III secretion system chaperone [Alcaligenes endophyticus]MDN4120068.1 SycD/LcrH family type III secretion system chaperone [Alcaligenes endophyticus]